MNEFSVDEGMEKQAKQSYKHEVHLLGPSNHFVVPVIDSLDWGKAAVLGKGEARKRWILGTEVAGTDAAAAVRMVADMAEEVDHMEVAAAEDFVHTL